MKATVSEIAASLGLHSASESIVDTLLTDSRSLMRPESSVFFAIKTPGGNDGHKYMRTLYDRGVRIFVGEDLPDNMKDCQDIVFLRVDNTVAALRTIAGLARNDSCERVGITGSYGKTTLKEWIFQLMEPIKEIARSPRSYNSQIGVPLSMWEIENSTEIALIEAGISKKGEMELLAQCIIPETVILTNIGEVHSEGFLSLEEKAREKVKLAEGNNVRNIIYNADDVILKGAVEKISDGKNVIGWSLTDKNAPLYLECGHFSDQHPVDVKYIYKGIENSFKAPLRDKTDLENAAGALAFILLHNVSPEVIRERFLTLHKIGTRLNVSEGINDCSIILDSYTSDFSSLVPAINFMMRRKTPEQKPVLIMSDIRHETAPGKDIYKAIARAVKDSGIERFIGIGPEMKKNSSLFMDGSEFFESIDDFIGSKSTSDFVSDIILLKGAPEFEFHRINELLEARKHETVLEVNLDSIVSNYNYFRSHLPAETGIVAMVKASGYGAGSYEIAKTMQDCGASYLAVAVLDEGIDLRKKGITMPIMVMNPKVVNYKSMFAYRLEPEIYSQEMLEDVIREAEKNGIQDYPIHLKLDTGMHRVGFLRNELEEVCKTLKGQNSVRLSSIFSHLATADCMDMDDYTRHQLGNFKEMTEYIMSEISYPVKRHILNSAGILRFSEHHYDMARLGIGLYGLNTLPPEVEKPLAVVSTLRTVIIAIREWESDETIGYGRRGVLTRKSRIATIPIGYADGMNRHFGRGNISVKVNGKDAPTVGNICMDACMIDVTDIDCKVCDDVEIFGPQAPVQRLADLLDTIPYEILTSVSPRVKRIYYRE